MASTADILIVGAGMAGLSCALELKKKGASVLVLEASDGVGGRVRSDAVDGFVLDRGFQVLLTAYPSCAALLADESMQWGTFDPGALVRVGGRDALVGDPFRMPSSLFSTAMAPVGNVWDKVLVARLRHRVLGMKLEEIWSLPDQSTLEYLRSSGFSNRMIESFFRPFMSGIFLEKDLSTSARMFHFVYRCFSKGLAALPAGGMGRIPDTLADQLGRDHIRLNSPAVDVVPGRVRLSSGEELSASRVVVAVDGDQASRWFSGLHQRAWNGGTCHYFAAPASPLGGRRLLWLNGTGKGRVNHLAVPSDIAAGYAPAGRSLVSVNSVGDAASPPTEDEVRCELEGFFGPAVRDWKFLRAYPLARSVPRFDPADAEALAQAPALPEGVYACGDMLGAGSLETAMASGRHAAGRLRASLA